MNSYASETEAIHAAQQGDLEAFNQLILGYQDFLFRVVLRIMREENLAADAVQEACLLAFNKLASFRNGSFRSWLSRIAVNVCYDELRRQRRHPLQPLEPSMEEGTEMTSPVWLADFSTNPELLLESRELERAIQGCLESILPSQRDVLILIDLEDFSYEETAKTLRIPIGTVKSRLARARIQMKEAWQLSTIYYQRQTHSCQLPRPDKN
jgi:RNA polymerase sigma-70 factor (ECF subfamily)